MYLCECGARLSIKSVSSHLQSLKHKKAMDSDEYYLGFIRRTRFLKENTKRLYLRKLQVITEVIWPRSTLKEVLSNPSEFLKRLDHYCQNKQGRLGRKTLGYHTRETYVSSIMALIIYNQKLKESECGTYESWLVISKKVKAINDAKYKSNCPTDRQKRGYVSYDRLLSMRDSLPLGSSRRLFLSMYIDIPPVRNDYYSTRLYPSRVEDMSGNYIVMDESLLVLNNYKTSKRYGEITIDLPECLMKEIEASLVKRPRVYLFSARDGEPYSKPGFNAWANRTLKSLFNKDRMTLSTLRHIYITRRDLKLEEKSGLEQDKIAKMMGHSVEQQKRYMWHAWDRLNDEKIKIRLKS